MAWRSTKARSTPPSPPRNSGLLDSQWREEEKRKKRFYILSAEGARVLEQLLAEWRSIDLSLEQILKEQSNGTR